MSDRPIIVTGAASGIGRAAARRLVEKGWRVALFDVDQVGGQAAAEELGEAALFVHTDMTDPAAVGDAAAATVAHFGGLAGIVNVAGGSGRRWGDGPVAEATPEGWHKTLDLNLTSVFLGCRVAVAHLLEAGQGGVVINVASVLGLVGGDADFGTHAYAASKGGAISLTRSIASYYAPQGIRANVICPGLIATPMSARAQQSEHIKGRLPALQPLTGDFGQPEDVAGAVAFLASEEARFITGAVLTVDGGWTTR
jgi:NAD(P)-dependent dehydrogenase (short-subunit alcohol dehydrogenase family)